MVSSDNKFMSLFMQLIDPQINLDKIYNKGGGGSLKHQIKKLQYALQGNVVFQCEGCLMCHFNATHKKAHLRLNRCPAYKVDFKPDMHKIFGLTLDNRLFSCHLGCNHYITNSRPDMCRHLLEHHTED